MTLKFDCTCGSRIAFDVEPEEGRMPVRLDCPGCGADITPLADREIAARLAQAAAAAPARTSMRITRSAEPAAPAPHTSAQEAPPGPGDDPAPAAPPKPARNQPRPPGFLARHGLRLAGMAALAALGGWIWFAFFASKPKVVFALPTTANAPFLHALLLDEKRLLLVTPRRIGVRDIVSDTESWGAELRASAPKPGPGDGDDPSDTTSVGVHVTAKHVWVHVGPKLLQFELAGGRRTAEFAVPEPLDEQHADPDGWTFVSGVSAGPAGERALTRIGFAAANAVTVKYVPPVAPRPQSFADPDTPVADPLVVAYAGNAVLQARLLESAFALKRPDPAGTRSAIDKENLRAADVDSVGREFIRAHTDYVVEDLGRYEVMIRRPFGGTAWKGTVNGRPRILALPSVDLLVAGKTATAFDKSGARLWQAALGATVAEPRDDDVGPVVEADDRVYLADRGTLHALSLRTGEPAWRLPSVGVSRVVATPAAVYVATTSAGPEGANLVDPRDAPGVYDVLLRVDPADGRVRWQAERVGDHVLADGQFLYAWHSAASRLDEISAAMNGTEAPGVLHLRRLDPASGRESWDWHRKGEPRTLGAVRNRVLVHKALGVEVLGFRTF